MEVFSGPLLLYLIYSKSAYNRILFLASNQEIPSGALLYQGAGVEGGMHLDTAFIMYAMISLLGVHLLSSQVHIKFN